MTHYAKGYQGEELVARSIGRLGLKVIYVGGAVKYTIDGPTFFCSDLLVYGYGRSFFVQVKHKEVRRKYGDTGLEEYQYNNLLKHQSNTGLSTLLLFTDKSGQIYGHWVVELHRLISCQHPDPRAWNKEDECWMIYFHRNLLQDYRVLLESHIPQPSQTNLKLEELFWDVKS